MISIKTVVVPQSLAQYFDLSKMPTEIRKSCIMVSVPDAYQHVSLPIQSVISFCEPQEEALPAKAKQSIDATEQTNALFCLPRANEIPQAPNKETINEPYYNYNSFIEPSRLLGNTNNEWTHIRSEPNPFSADDIETRKKYSGHRGTKPGLNQDYLELSSVLKQQTREQISTKFAPVSEPPKTIRSTNIDETIKQIQSGAKNASIEVCSELEAGNYANALRILNEVPGTRKILSTDSNFIKLLTNNGEIWDFAEDANIKFNQRAINSQPKKLKDFEIDELIETRSINKIQDAVNKLQATEEDFIYRALSIGHYETARTLANIIFNRAYSWSTNPKFTELAKNNPGVADILNKPLLEVKPEDVNLPFGTPRYCLY